MKALKIIMLSTLVIGLAVVSVLWHDLKPALAQDKQYRIAVVVHGSDADPFWKPVKKGVEDASSLYTDLKVTYTGTPAYSLEGFMGNLRSALETKPDALVCTLTEPDAMDETLREAIGAGLPVIGINAPDLREPVDD